MRPATDFANFQQAGIPRKAGELPAYIVVDGDHRIEALNSALDLVHSKKDKGRCQAFSYVQVVLWTHKSGLTVTFMEMLQIGAACNDAVEVSRKMEFMDTFSLCVAMAARAEQYLQSQVVLAEGANLDNKALGVVLAELGVLDGSRLYSVEKFG